MSVSSLSDLLLRYAFDGSGSAEPIRAAIGVDGGNREYFAAIRECTAAGWLRPLMVGTSAGLDRAAGLDSALAGYDRIEADDFAGAVAMISAAARNSQADIALFPPGSGDQVLQDALPRESWYTAQRELLAGITVFRPSRLERPLLVADTQVHAEPDEEQLARIVQVSIRAAKAIGIATPRVALLAAVEVASPGLPVTMRAQAVSEVLSAHPGSFIEGPLSMDLAVSEHAARLKGAKGDVVGRADVLIAPNITVARGVQQALSILCDCPCGASIAGSEAPFAIPPRGREAEGTRLSLLLAAAFAKGCA